MKTRCARIEFGVCFVLLQREGLLYSLVAMRNEAKVQQKAAILVATPDMEYGATLVRFLEANRYRAERCHDAAGFLRRVGLHSFACIVLDLALAEDAPMDLLSFAMEKQPETRVILLYEMAAVDRALEGIRQGAYFYLPRNSQPSDVALIVEKAMRSRRTDAAMGAYEQNVFEELVGRTPAMQRVVELIRKVAPTDSTVLLLGESGVGKEIVANTIHRLSRRKERPFVAINCAALPEALLESEMFGHVRGAFTGAERDKAGLFEEANGGTIFLDEIGDMSAITQAKLLRVLQSGDIRRVGATVSKKVDVRVIAATNRDLLEAVSRNQFREDLYFRLNVIQIRIPPLRERMDALAALIPHFIGRHAEKFGKRVRGVDERAMALLRHYDYPGNVRELESIIAHAVIMAEGDLIQPQDLPEQVVFGVKPRLALPYAKRDGVKSLAEVEAEYIRYAMERLDHNQSLVAKKLGISRSTLWRKLKEYGMDKMPQEASA